MKKIYLLIVILLGMTTLFACGTNDVIDEPVKNPIVFETEESLLGFSVISAVTIAGSIDTYSPQTLSSQGTFLLNETGETNNTVEDAFEVLSSIGELEEYLDLMYTFLGSTDNGFKVAVEENIENEYAYTMIITTSAINGDVNVFRFYYNEETVELEDDEYETVIDGIMILDQVTYIVNGVRKVESDSEELQLIAKLDDENYVTMHYEIESDDEEVESKYEYEMYVDNVLVKQIEIDFEQEEDEKEMKLFFLEGLLEREFSFEVEFDEEELKIEIEYLFVLDGETVEEGKIEIIVVYDEELNQFVVRYEIEVEGHERIVIESDKYKDDDEDEDEEDEDDEDEEDEDDEEDEEEIA
jgi:hypothetical protein